MTAIAVGIVENHALTRRGLVELLGEAGDMVVPWTAASVDEMTAQLRAGADPADVTLLDRSLPGGGPQGSHAVAAVVSTGSRVIVVSRTDSPGAVAAALHAGASGYVTKDAAEGEVVAAVRIVAGGGTYLAEALRDRTDTAPPARLSPRERQIVGLLAGGNSDATIAARLGITIRTVRTHLDRISAKVGVRKRGKLAHWAIEHDLLPPDDGDPDCG